MKIVKEKYYNRRTKSGYWSKVKENYSEKIISEDDYLKFTSPDYMWKSDKITRGYTKFGYSPIRITNTSPSNDLRVVYNFKFIYEY